MKQAFVSILLLLSISCFSQAKPDSGVTVKKEVPVVIRSFYDTIKVKIYYEDDDYIRIKKGFAIRLIETNSAHPEQNRVAGITYFDEKMKPFKLPVFQVAQR